MVVKVVTDCVDGLFKGKNVGDKQVVWMSHDEEAVRLPDGFEVLVFNNGFFCIVCMDCFSISIIARGKLIVIE